MSFTLSHTTRTYPTLPYEIMKNDLLGGAYELSLVFVGNTQSQRLNQTYRNKSYIPNVLSFPLDDTHGEIFINPTQALRESRAHDMSPSGFVGFLFIHGLLHLKGYQHGDTMESAESRYKKKYHLT